jgi:hypothetical protein
MKILELGKTKEQWTIQHRCTGWGGDDEGCEALLEIDWNDLRYRPGYFDEKCDCSPTVCFKCPCCDQVTYLGMNDWPKDHRKLKQWTYEWHFNKTDAA